MKFFRFRKKRDNGRFSWKNLSPEFRQKKKAAEILIADSRDSADYYVMLIIATLIITFGLVENNAAVIIGGMLVAPVLFPILALGLGAASMRPSLFIRSLRVLIASVVLILTLSSAVAYFMDPGTFVNTQVELRLSFSILSVGVAFLAGFAGAYAWVRESLRANLPGVAIAVALLPPLCVTGIQLAHNNVEGVASSFLLFGINVGGIFIASLIVFVFFGYKQVQGIVEKTMKEEQAERADE
ncbi:TIGR00341 family protein [Candidatus Peregrinibacteria bacterium]|jgi:uncharacterized hydrophobic protein (TIGR00271 family)|nr:TIGR00341 family protein [Candidatus Peregrinibacteria bacterium]